MTGGNLHRSNGERRMIIFLPFQPPSESEKELYDAVTIKFSTELERSSLKLDDLLGKGAFGEVRKARWQKSPTEVVAVAVKLHSENTMPQLVQWMGGGG